jgi:hypothetical protein
MNFDQPVKKEDIKTPESKIKEGVDFIFEQNPKLAQIGTKEQYSEYLDTIFPESKIKEIVYHGTNKNSYKAILKDGFNLSKSGSNLGYMGKIMSFFTIKGYTNIFENGAIVYSLININSKFIDNSGNLNKEGMNELKLKLLDLKIIPFVNNLDELNNDIISVNDNDRNIGFKTARDTTRLINYLFSRIKNPQDVYNLILADLGISGLKRNDIIVDMLSVDQIYVLGSKKDIENFKKFVSKKEQ